VKIGNNTALGANVKIYDTDFHSIDPYIRINQTSITEAKSMPIIIGQYVWIGADSIILKGVQIEDFAIVGAGSVVSKNVGRFEMHAGNPAKLIKVLSVNLSKE
jgi:acetyltransferase-like isoleucine patch superfamily enzyme